MAQQAFRSLFYASLPFRLFHRFPLNAVMPQTGGQRHTRSGSKRRVSFAATSSIRKHEDHFTGTIFVVLAVFLCMAVTFGRFAPSKAAAAGGDDHLHTDIGKRSTPDIHIPPLPRLQLRGSRERIEKRAIKDASSRSGERSTTKVWLHSLEQNKETDINIIVGTVDAASKVAQAAAEVEMAAIAAAEDKDATSTSNLVSGVAPWVVSPGKEENISHLVEDTK